MRDGIRAPHPDGPGLESLQGDVAQLVEHCLCKAGVRGSSPLISTQDWWRQPGPCMRRDRLEHPSRSSHSRHLAWGTAGPGNRLGRLGVDLEDAAHRHQHRPKPLQLGRQPSVAVDDRMVTSSCAASILSNVA